MAIDPTTPEQQHSDARSEQTPPPQSPIGNPAPYFSPSYNYPANLNATQYSAAMMNPMHASTSKGAKKTPLEVQLGLTALPIRYLPRALAKSATDSASPSILHKISGISWVRDNFYFPAYLDSLNKRLNQFNPHIASLFPEGTHNLDGQKILERMRASPEGKTLIDDIKKLQGRWDASNLANNTVEYFLANHGKNKVNSITKESHDRLRGRMGEMMFELAFDNIIGAGSWYYTRKVQSGVHNDIMSIYSEAVSFENGKPARDIKDNDIAGSSNEIIRSTVKNYRNKRALRYGISTMPFLKNVPSLRALQWGEATVAAWGIMWARDILVREPTMLENFRSFINDKLNPLYGIGDPIKSSEIIDLYQQYAYRFHPEISFRSISVNDEDANLMWAQSEKLFGRVAELMNESYNFKHTTELDPETHAPKVKANFTLPKLIYLMGHGLLNARRPEWSMVFLELANQSVDMHEVKEAAKAMQQNVGLSEIVEKYGIDLNPNNHINGVAAYARPKATANATAPEQPKDAETKSAPSTDASRRKPSTKVQSDGLKADNLNHEIAASSARASA